MEGTSSVGGAEWGGELAPRPLEALLILPDVQAINTSEP